MKSYYETKKRLYHSCRDWIKTNRTIDIQLDIIIQFTIRKYGVRLITHIELKQQQQRQSFKFNQFGGAA